ncbi:MULTISPECIES: porin [unclassified Burkholderia]|uniref:porin n=1 Tax=unclassified Burkholderia TaxID=2613784 RepID=UPI000F590435|nr:MULTISPECIES: porin [unclassified Burkholderia]RQS19122.1 porin [Burkholderia sp. Bp8995]RQS38883.1 porin [Burkholderia sp. Bp8989]
MEIISGSKLAHRMSELAAVAMLLCSNAVFAQSSIAIYGDLDIGAQYLTNADANGKSVFGLQSGNASPTRFGLTGAEDLGGGYKAIFKLESGFNIANGQYVFSGVPFDRYAYVGLDSKFGTLTFGRQRSLLFEQSVLYDPTYLAQFSTMSTNYIPLGSLNQNNAVKYISAPYAGVSGALMYGFGQQVAGNFRAGQFISGSLAYEVGGFGARVVYEQSKGTVTTAPSLDQSGLVDRRVSLAARYKRALTTAYAWYTNVSGDLHYSPPGNVYGGGLSQQFFPDFSVVGEVNHYQTRDDSGHPTWFTIGALYNLSKRTTLYVFGSVLRNNGGRGFTVNTYDLVSPGNTNQTGVQVGINHLF